MLTVIGTYLWGDICKIISDYDYYGWRLDCELRSLCGSVDRLLPVENDAAYGIAMSGIDTVTGWLKTRETFAVASRLVADVGRFVAGFMVMIVAAVYMSRDLEKYRKIKVRCVFKAELDLLYGGLLRLFRVYFCTQLVIMICTGCICAVGLLLIGNTHGVLVGALIGLLDALPLVGTGTVLIPWSLWLMFKGKMVHATVLLIVYAVTYILREVPEGKLMGDRLGVSPVAIFASIYMGILVFWLWGIMLGPVCLSLCRSLIHVLKCYLKGGRITAI